MFLDSDLIRDGWQSQVVNSALDPGGVPVALKEDL
jgi:hypothetical protein